MTQTETKKQRRTKPVILLTAFAFLIAAALLFRWSVHEGIVHAVYCHLYSGPRMTCSVTVHVDGKPCRLQSSDVQGGVLANLQINSVSDFQSLESGGRFRCEGGEYGSQPFAVTFQTENMPEPVYIPVDVIVPCCWEMTDVALNVDADTASKTFDYQLSMKMGREEFSRNGSVSYQEGNGQPFSPLEPEYQNRNEIRVSGV
ncbi:MAG: hypothetical protein J6Z40_12345 [Oscillospiraceae bacterium]|nr:hypothetical protein [Oscillospiraceae bacterium]